jgi:hypothetical protein
MLPFTVEDIWRVQDDESDVVARIQQCTKSNVFAVDLPFVVQDLFDRIRSKNGSNFCFR